MKKYRVTADLTTDQLLKFLEIAESQVLGIGVIYDEGSMPSTDAVTSHLSKQKPFKPRYSAPTDGVPRQRKLRGSKVNDTILGKLREGQTHISELKNVMANAGLKPTSLSTALSLLKKSGRIKGMGEGMYELAEAA